MMYTLYCYIVECYIVENSRLCDEEHVTIKHFDFDMDYMSQATAKLSPPRHHRGQREEVADEWLTAVRLEFSRYAIELTGSPLCGRRKTE